MQHSFILFSEIKNRAQIYLRVEDGITQLKSPLICLIFFILMSELRKIIFIHFLLQFYSSYAYSYGIFPKDCIAQGTCLGNTWLWE